MTWIPLLLLRFFFCVCVRVSVFFTLSTTMMTILFVHSIFVSSSVGNNDPNEYTFYFYSRSKNKNQTDFSHLRMNKDSTSSTCCSSTTSSFSSSLLNSFSFTDVDEQNDLCSAKDVHTLYFVHWTLMDSIEQEHLIQAIELELKKGIFLTRAIHISSDPIRF